MATRTLISAAIAAAFAVASLGATAQTTTTTSTSTSTTVSGDRLVQKYTTLAGSEQNAKSLVYGLRNGSEVKLSSSTSSATPTKTSTTTAGTTTTTSSTSGTTFQPATGKMGYGNVNIALSLAEASLKQQGIANPTPEQLKTALNGGTITTSSGTVKVAGVLQMRADGMGWGKIANTMGFKVGELMRPGKVDTASREGRDAGKPEKAERAEHAEHGKPERVAKVDKVERVERVERVEKVERPQRPERPERAGK